MRILDETVDSRLNNVLLLLTTSEALQLRGYLNSLLNHEQDGHRHLNDFGADVELSVAVYQPDQAGDFTPRVVRLIRDNA